LVVQVAVYGGWRLRGKWSENRLLGGYKCSEEREALGATSQRARSIQKGQDNIGIRGKRKISPREGGSDIGGLKTERGGPKHPVWGKRRDF